VAERDTKQAQRKN